MSFRDLIKPFQLMRTIPSLSPIYQTSIRHLRNWPVPPRYDAVEYPERRKLKIVDKVPTYPAGIRPPKMQRRLIYMRGPELIHNKFVHEQYGIVATSPGRLRYGHFEMIRLTLGRKLDTSRMFAVWRVDPPWQSVTKKGQGKQMGGGKPSIDHYVTPIKSGRVIVEIGGNCEFEEVKPLVKDLIGKLPFGAVFLSHELMLEAEEKEKQLAASNLNPYTVEYLIKNNMGMSQTFISPFDRKWFFKHI